MNNKSIAFITLAVIGLFSAPAWADCPTGPDPADSCDPAGTDICTTVIISGSLFTLDCDLGTEAPEFPDADGLGCAIYDPAGNDDECDGELYCVWGKDMNGNAFYCDPSMLGADDGDLRGVTIRGSDWDDDIYFEWTDYYLNHHSAFAQPVKGLIRGNSGDDFIEGSRSTDGDYSETLRGNAGADEIWGLAGDHEIIGDGQDDTIYGEAGVDDITGGDGNDTIHGGAGDDIIAGDGGSDKIKGDDGDDTIDGNAGNDAISGGNNDDTINGGVGDDTLCGQADDGAEPGDVLYGDGDNDYLWGNGTYDHEYGGTGIDSCSQGGTWDSCVYTGSAPTCP